jgi:hypothetical protein
MTALQNAHVSLAPLSVRELDFLAGIIAYRIERLLEFEDDDRDGEDDDRDGEEVQPELRLVA